MVTIIVRFHCTVNTTERSFTLEYYLNKVIIIIRSQIEEALVQRKKVELIQKYASDYLQAEEDNVKDLLGV